ncbi:transcription factor MYBS3 [Capsicum chacoense]
MGRKCSHCGYIGHNTRTCSTLKCAISGSNFIGGLKLFGVQLDIASSSSSSSSSSSFSSHNLKKSFSLDCLSLTNSHVGHSHLSSSLSPSPSINESCEKSTTSINNNGYLSDGIGVGCVGERKKGAPWTEDEHRKFLIGLEKLGKGDWRGISRNFVTTRTPTQVASHAQKYFLRQSSINKKKRRSSLFDMASINNKFEDCQENSHWIYGSQNSHHNEVPNNKSISSNGNIDLELSLSNNIVDKNIGSIIVT